MFILIRQTWISLFLLMPVDFLRFLWGRRGEDIYLSTYKTVRLLRQKRCTNCTYSKNGSRNYSNAWKETSQFPSSPYFQGLFLGRQFETPAGQVSNQSPVFFHSVWNLYTWNTPRCPKPALINSSTPKQNSLSFCHGNRALPSLLLWQPNPTSRRCYDNRGLLLSLPSAIDAAVCVASDSWRGRAKEWWRCEIHSRGCYTLTSVCFWMLVSRATAC